MCCDPLGSSIGVFWELLEYTLRKAVPKRSSPSPQRILEVFTSSVLYVSGRCDYGDTFNISIFLFFCFCFIESDIFLEFNPKISRKIAKFSGYARGAKNRTRPKNGYNLSFLNIFFPIRKIMKIG